MYSQTREQVQTPGARTGSPGPAATLASEEESRSVATGFYECGTAFIVFPGPTRLISTLQCDEHRPSCRNCSRHGTGCDFVHDSGAPSPSRQLSNGAGNGDLGMLDLELMHHYTASTYTTLSADPTIRSLWRGPVVRMALGCPYLMRAVLAVSALHLAHYRPEAKDRYLCVALQHHQLASRHAAALMSDLSRVEGENLFVFSVLTMVFGLFPPPLRPGQC